MPVPGPFLAALRAVRESRVATATLLQAVPVTTVREMLGAVLLDHAGLQPGDLTSPATTTVLVSDDSLAADAVLDCLRSLHPHGAGVLVIGRGNNHAAYDDAVDRGLPVVVVTWDRIGVLPHEAVLLADRDVELPYPVCVDVIERLTEAVTGVGVRVAGVVLEGLTIEGMLRAIPLGASPEDVSSKLTRAGSILQGLEAERAREAARDAAEELADDEVVPSKPAAPVPVGAAAASVVRRLSEMTGFGEAAVWGCNLARDLAAYKAGALPWTDVDRGLLLSGPPGTGKTTFARALALECEVDLVTTTYNEWSAMGSGDSMSKGMTRLFDTWRDKGKKAPFILFIDEIDSIGSRGGAAHNESWFAPIINGWLAFLDGAVPRAGVVVVAATNLPERIDLGLLRPGRLERHLELPMPDVAALVGIVRAHLGPDAVLTDGELAEAARAVRGRSPAQVQLLAREARRVARWCGRRVCASDLTDAVAMLREPRHADVDWRIAVHEAGHAAAAVALGADELLHVDVDVGWTGFERRALTTRREADKRLTVLLAARAAEEALIGEVSSGCSQDLIDATQLAGNVHRLWGMGAMGLLALSDGVAEVDPALRVAVKHTLDEAYARAVAVVTERRDDVERLARELQVRRYLDAAEVRTVLAGPVAPPPRVERSAPMLGPAVRRTITRPGAARGPS